MHTFMFFDTGDNFLVGTRNIKSFCSDQHMPRFAVVLDIFYSQVHSENDNYSINYIVTYGYRFT